MADDDEARAVRNAMRDTVTDARAELTETTTAIRAVRAPAAAPTHTTDAV